MAFKSARIKVLGFRSVVESVNRRVINVALIIFSARNWCVPRTYSPPRPDERSLRSERGAVINNKSAQNIPAIQGARADRVSGNEFREYLRSILHLTRAPDPRHISSQREEKGRLEPLFGREKSCEYEIPIEYEIREVSPVT